MEIDDKNIKCPLCEKDMSFSWAGKEVEISCSENNPVFYRSLQCHHCGEITFFLFKGLTEEKKEEIQAEVTACAIPSSFSRGARNYKPPSASIQKLTERESELEIQYPYRKTVFCIEGIPSKVKESLAEAEKCFSFGAKNGCATCLRKCIYAICDDAEKSNGLKHIKYYDEKIENLFPKNKEFSELTKQIKWLGDNHAHNINEEKYTDKDVKKALDIMPSIIREIYGNKAEIRQVRNLLNQGLQRTKLK